MSELIEQRHVADLEAVQGLPTARELRLKMLAVDCIVAIPALAVMLFYILTLVEATAAEWRSFALAGATYGVFAAAAFEPGRRSFLRPLYLYLGARTSGGEVSRDQVRAAFRCAVSLPRFMLVLMVLLWCSAVVYIPAVSWLMGQPGWLKSGHLGVLLVAAATGALVSSSFLYFLVKRSLEQVRGTIASEIRDPEERRALMPRVPLARKVQYVVAGTLVASLLFSLGIAYSRAGRAIDEMAASWQHKALQSMPQARTSADIEHSVSQMFSDPTLMPYPTSFEAINGEAREDAPPYELLVRERLTLGEPAGVYTGLGGDEVVSWFTTPAGAVLVATTPRDALRESLSGVLWILGIVLLIATGISVAVAVLFAADVSRGVSTLRKQAERMALGDLRPGAVFESEDELGDLARAFDRMGGALRATVGRVAEAADRVESSAGDISRVSESVGAASADQVRRIQQANELMLEIKAQIGGVADSAQALNVSVEESSSSILELGAASDELNDTASVLSTKVDDVSSSIEQMVRSVKQVGSTSEALSDAAAETSSSMEEMASAMRAVDTTAEKTADLSRGVVSSAENGQDKVRQTIVGMEAIRDATDTAERVIQGLGTRAVEIGAILDVIDDVADETNLLALNAAIIAAQAGEHGRAFSVVADEIKELADRVLASTKEIGGLIRAVQSESENAQGAVEEGSRSVASGVELSAEAGLSLEEITRNSRESGTRIGEIVTAVQEQTKAASHVVELMERVRSGVEQIRSAGAEQDHGNEVVHRSALTMREVAQQVRRTTEEQSRGFGRIRESVEGVREAVEQINGSLQEQSTACSQVAEFLEQVYERTRSNEESGGRMDEAMQGLVRQAEALREDVAKFQI